MKLYSMKRGVSLIETLAAVLIVGIVAAAAASTWGVANGAAKSKRYTEMSTYLGVREIERLKAKQFANLAISAVDSNNNPIPTVTYFDKLGASAVSGTSSGYKVMSTITTAVSRGTGSVATDLREIQVQVWSGDGVTRYDDGNIRTLMTSGGM